MSILMVLVLLQIHRLQRWHFQQKMEHWLSVPKLSMQDYIGQDAQVRAWQN